ncbi:MAG: pyruvate/oxaloacetate carboxyltransferase [Candidatus Eisenbacteria sp.]|nr:pyruvate/oxaloacetate carboxyltransferase [Candidatus Eisenbacteria bacterium]
MAESLRITDTVLRDAHQSLFATRMSTDDMLPITGELDEVGFHSLEMWGGATFDSAMRFLGEDPWERLRRLREALPKTKLQMLLRGQNLVGYRHYPDDVVESFVVQAARNGIDIFRIFDALNDPRNMRYAMEIVKREGKHAQATLSYTLSPFHSIEKFADLAGELAKMGADSICIKDMAGLLAPYATEELVRALKQRISIPVQLHTHYTSGMASMVLLKAAETGVDIVDTAISSMALLTSQAPTESLVSALQDTPRDTKLDLARLARIARYFADVRRRYLRFESGMAGVDVNVLEFQIPGGMLSNLVSQLREQGAEDKYMEVLAEVPRVRKEMGYPPLVTPSSQIVGTQATLNVVLGKRYKVVPEEVKNYFRGYYGRPPAPIDAEIRRQVIGDEEPIDCRPADRIAPGLEKAREEIGTLAQSEEDVLSYALFPQVARPFLKLRQRGIDRSEAIVAAVAARLLKERERTQVTAPGTGGRSGWKAAAGSSCGSIGWGVGGI